MMLACDEMFLSVMIVCLFIEFYDDVCAHCLVGSARLCRSDPNALVLSDNNAPDRYCQIEGYSLGDGMIH